MRQNRNIKTYGRHRKRVIATDVWTSDNEKKRHVFSTSSELDQSKSSSIFHISSDHDGGSFSDSSLFMTGKNKKNAGNAGKKTEKQCNKENIGARRRLRAKQTRKLKLFSEDCSSTSNTSASSVSSDAASSNRRALRERNKNVRYKDDVDIEKNKGRGKRKRPERIKIVNKPLEKVRNTIDLSVNNFSEFDDYSLVIVSPSKKDDKDVMETSTPVAKRTRLKDQSVEPIAHTDISHIECISPCSEAPSPSIGESPIGGSSTSDIDQCNLSSITGSNSISIVSPELKSENLSNSLKRTSNASGHSKYNCERRSPDDGAILERLQESFVKMHVSRRQNTKYSNKSEVSVFDNSRSLFSCYDDNSLTDRLASINESIHKSIDDSKDQLENGNVCENGDGDGDLDEEDSDYEEEEEEEEESNEDESGDDLSAIEEDEDEEEEESESRQSSESNATLYMLNEEVEDEDNKGGSFRKRIERRQSAKFTDTLYMLNEEVEDEEEEKDTAGYRNIHKIETRQSSKPSETLYKEVDEEDDEEEDSLDMLEEEDDSRESINIKVSRIMTRQACEPRATLPMLNEEGEDSMSSSRSTSEENDSANMSQSMYCTADSDDPETYHTAEDSPKYTLRNRQIQSLAKSFTELLTPTKKKKTDVILSPRSKIHCLCDQTDPISFQTCIPASVMKNCVKIGEGVYGEVFRTYKNNTSVALKIIPIEGQFTVNDEPQKTFAEILPEIVISKELSCLRNNRTCTTYNFCQVNRVSCVKGKYPRELLQQWDKYHKEKGSENDRPDIFGHTQLFIVFEFADGGRDLESYRFNNIREARSVLSQVAHALAVAEEAFQFEHRDLHWGNVLVRETDRKSINYKLLGQEKTVVSEGVEVSIIDFTLSRLEKDGSTVYCDLSTDDTLFDGTGDYQFDIYRKMKEENRNNWEPFNPHTNVLWLHYLADKLVYSTHYTSNTKEDRDILREFRMFLRDTTHFHSASELVLESTFLNS